MATSHARGMQDYDAIERKGQYAIDSAYQNIYDSLDQARDIANALSKQATATMVGAAASLFKSY